MWKLQWLVLGPYINEFRSELKLPEAFNVGLDCIPVLQMFSTLVVPRPKDYPSHVIDTGYWVLPPEDYIPDSDLEDFLNDGSPPVYIGFGSMPVKHKQKIVDLFSSALKKTNQRAIYCGGWSNISDLKVPENIFFIKGAPHEWLLPQCCMAFHHGGAGTTAASLRAGIPTIILSVLVDQPFWSSRVVDLGVGQSEPCALRDITETYLKHQIKHCLKDSVKKAAAELGKKLINEDGTHLGASYIISYATKNRNPGIKQMDYKADSTTDCCMDCKEKFTFFLRKHHCMSCGNIYCAKCVKYFDLPNYETWRYCCRSCAEIRNLNFNSQ